MTFEENQYGFVIINTIVTINPADDLVANTTYSVQITSDEIIDTDGVAIAPTLKLYFPMCRSLYCPSNSDIPKIDGIPQYLCRQMSMAHCHFRVGMPQFPT